MFSGNDNYLLCDSEEIHLSDGPNSFIIKAYAETLTGESFLLHIFDLDTNSAIFDLYCNNQVLAYKWALEGLGYAEITTSFTCEIGKSVQNNLLEEWMIIAVRIQNTETGASIEIQQIKQGLSGWETQYSDSASEDYLFPQSENVQIHIGPQFDGIVNSVEIISGSPELDLDQIMSNSVKF